MKSGEINSLFKNLSRVIKNPRSDLKYRNKFTLLVSVVLSAQCTDVNVNNVTQNIYPKYNKPEHFVKLKKRVVIGTTGFSKKEENLIKKYSRKIPILKAGNMSLGINLLMYLTEIASKSLGDNFLSKVFEVHHKHKKDHPSGTALMLGKGIAIGKKKDFYKLVGKKYLNKKTFPFSKKINFNSVRKGEIVGNHKVFFSSGKETIILGHEAFDRALYSEGAFTAAKWLMSKKPGLYSMRNVLNFK